MRNHFNYKTLRAAYDILATDVYSNSLQKQWWNIMSQGLAFGAAIENTTPKLRVVTIGDTFAERYIWAGAPLLDEPGVPVTPYVSPDEMRARAFSETYIEISGTPLHRRIYESYLSQFGFGPSDVQVESVPNDDNIAEALAKAAHPELWEWDNTKTENKPTIRDILLRKMKSSSFPLDGSRSPFPVFYTNSTFQFILHERKT